MHRPPAPHPPPQSNRPVAGNQLVFYYEVTILDHGELGKIGIGFTPRDVKLTRQPGCARGSGGRQRARARRAE